jgi:hypothetical protein
MFRAQRKISAVKVYIASSRNRSDAASACYAKLLFQRVLVLPKAHSDYNAM